LSHKYALDLESKKDIEIPETKQEIQQLKDLINKGPGDWSGTILQDEDEEGLQRKERLMREVAQVTSEADTYYPPMGLFLTNHLRKHFFAPLKK